MFRVLCCLRKEKSTFHILPPVLMGMTISVWDRFVKDSGGENAVQNQIYNL